MKRKTFNYHSMQTFFIKHNLPLSDRQMHLLRSLIREEEEALAKEREKREIKKTQRNQKRLKRILDSHGVKLPGTSGAPGKNSRTQEPKI